MPDEGKQVDKQVDKQIDKQVERSRIRRVLVAACLAAFVIALVACAPSQTTNAPGGVVGDTDEEQSLTYPAWSEESNCTSCHGMEADSSSDSGSVFATIAQQSNATCSSCHSDEEGQMTAVHADYAADTSPSSLKATTVARNVCLSCHDVEDLKARTASVTALMDTNGTVINPHDQPFNEHHASDISCTSCHRIHTAYDAAENVKKVCAGCHHAGVYEACSSCHG
ncbi:MAG: cytochrome c3 family protein [Coriobacteriales bacterium]|jgi:hypothetical protein|nr:cytochrome c3 family protein [Coriobacteriales bacterium]